MSLVSRFFVAAICRWLQLSAVLWTVSGALLGADESIARPPVYLYCSVADARLIQVLSFDSQTGKVAKSSSLGTPGEPAALTSSADGRYLFASMRDTGRLCSFRIDSATGGLTLLSDVAAGADPAQITLDRSGQYLFAAYYEAAKVSVHRVGADGRLSDAALQEIATAEKAHAIVPDPTNRLVFVPHTGPNRIYQFRFEELVGRLLPEIGRAHV